LVILGFISATRFHHKIEERGDVRGGGGGGAKN